MIVTKFLNFILIVGIILSVVLIGFSVPFIQGMLKCYDTAVDNFDDIEASARSYGWQQEKLCELKATNIQTLDVCASNAMTKSALPQKIKDIIIERLPMVRPNTQSVDTRKTQHDAECADYPSTLFHLPANNN